ncbi:hypothetical protein PR003_g23841 [Phytophthora rubi]|uniref:RxLR effector protein n=1 Tax=Phytophthora rubi TaxID=129364 RepID=A0A6A4CTB7_9STRA|nr:hypothetical protein PR002_g30044 [Phytophthora rubi]KAE9296103.1 hypothetical protein PR003_g23841 [Phytophthora rubi]
MRISSIFVLAMAALLASVNSDEVKASPNVAPTSRRSLSPRDRGTPQRSLRLRDTEDADDSEEEERVGGTEIVQKFHGLGKADAKMVRQIAKGNSEEHILNKLAVPFEVVHGKRVYHENHPDYVRYQKWLKRGPLTYSA